jgi:hypothetical protein
VLHVEGTKGGHDDGLPKAVRPGDTSQLRLTKTGRLTRRALLVARPWDLGLDGQSQSMLAGPRPVFHHLTTSTVGSQ